MSMPSRSVLGNLTVEVAHAKEAGARKKRGSQEENDAEKPCKTIGKAEIQGAQAEPGNKFSASEPTDSTALDGWPFQEPGPNSICPLARLAAARFQAAPSEIPMALVKPSMHPGAGGNTCMTMQLHCGSYTAYAATLSQAVCNGTPMTVNTRVAELKSWLAGGFHCSDEDLVRLLQAAAPMEYED